MNTAMNTAIRSRLAALTVFAAIVLSHDAFAVTVMGQPTVGKQSAVSGRLQGVVEAVAPDATIRISGITYVFSRSTAKIYDKTGRAATYIDLAKGTQVSFLTRKDGSRERITELWVNK